MRASRTASLFRYTSKVSRQVLRFLKPCFHNPASPGLYEYELQPLGARGRCLLSIPVMIRVEVLGDDSEKTH